MVIPEIATRRETGTKKELEHTLVPASVRLTPASNYRPQFGPLIRHLHEGQFDHHIVTVDPATGMRWLRQCQILPLSHITTMTRLRGLSKGLLKPAPTGRLVSSAQVRR